MADDELRQRADQRFEQALKDAGARDPRDFYRAQMVKLREAGGDGYKRALGYFQTRLIPRVAEEASDPLREWLEYGRVLAVLTAPGRTVQLDPSGKASDYAPPVPRDHLVLHLPEKTNQPAILVGLPAKLSPAQKAAYGLLVKGEQGS